LISRRDKHAAGICRIVVISSCDQRDRAARKQQYLVDESRRCHSTLTSTQPIKLSCSRITSRMLSQRCLAYATSRAGLRYRPGDTLLFDERVKQTRIASRAFFSVKPEVIVLPHCINIIFFRGELVDTYSAANFATGISRQGFGGSTSESCSEYAMDTLYDMLGALPHDDAEGLRAAFRRAVKGAHPDLRPDDPDAAVKFRQIVRANEILCDKDQRAAYDHLLGLAQAEKDPASAHPIAAKVHKIASTVLAMATVSIVAAGGYFLFMHMSMALAPPAGGFAAAHVPLNTVDLTTRLSASIAAVSPADAPDPAAVSAFIAAKTDSIVAARTDSAPEAAAGSTNDTPATPAEPESASLPSAEPADPAPDYANFFHARGVVAYGNGDLSGAAVDSDQTAQLETKFTSSYVDRGILFFREKKDERAFPDLSQLKRADKGGHARSVVASAGKSHSDTTPKDALPKDALPKVVPLPQPRTVLRVIRLQSWYASRNSAFQ
jgi:DnaJ domain